MQRLRRTLTPWLAMCLAALLLAAQALGLVHGVAHGLGGPAAGDGWGHGKAVVHSHPHFHTPANPACDDGHAQAHTPPSQAAHGHSQASAECTLYDQLLGHADALPAAPCPATCSGTAAPLCAEGVPAPGRQAAAAYQARAPPAA